MDKNDNKVTQRKKLFIGWLKVKLKWYAAYSIHLSLFIMYVSKNIKLNKKYSCSSMGSSIISTTYDMIRFDYKTILKI